MCHTFEALVSGQSLVNPDVGICVARSVMRRLENEHNPLIVFYDSSPGARKGWAQQDSTFALLDEVLLITSGTLDMQGSAYFVVSP